jgi:hypothetical protein
MKYIFLSLFVSNFAFAAAAPSYSCTGNLELFNILDIYVLNGYDFKITLKEVQKEHFILKGKFSGLSQTGVSKSISVDTIVPFTVTAKDSYIIRPGFLEKKADMKLKVISANEASLDFDILVENGKVPATVKCSKAKRKLFSN